MRAIITRETDGIRWRIETYKSVDVCDSLIVNGLWESLVRTDRNNDPIKWVIADHKQITPIDRNDLPPLIERLDMHRDSDILHWKIAGKVIVFTVGGVFTSDEREAGKVVKRNLPPPPVIQEVHEEVHPTVCEAVSPPEPHHASSVTELIVRSSREAREAKERQESSLEEYYFQRYGEPVNDIEAQGILVKVYEELLGAASPEVRGGIAEYFRIIQARQLPAFYWMMEAFHVLSKKVPAKRTFPYVVGMLRSWLKNGFGHIPSSEEDDVMHFFNEIIGFEMSREAKQVIQTLLGTYGAVKCAIAIPEIRGTDFSYFMAISLKDVLDAKYAGK